MRITRLEMPEAKKKNKEREKEREGEEKMGNLL